MKIVKNKSTEGNREFWSHVESVAKEVESWPKWMAKSTEESACRKGPAQSDNADEQDELRVK
jgi:hypothetical protein